MILYRMLRVVLLMTLLTLGACAPTTPAAPSITPAPTQQPATEAGVTLDAGSVLAPPTDTPAPEVPQGTDAAWLTTPFINARTGETFTLADFSGKTVFVESMATWCSNCRSQMRNVRDVIGILNSDDYVFIGLSVETNISASDLATYVDAQEFPWTFAVMSPDALQILTDAFGRSITNPPVTPHFVIKPDGTTDGLVAGQIHSVEALIAELTAANGS